MTVDDRIGMLADVEAVALLQRFSRAQPKTDVPAALDASVANQMRKEVGLAEEAMASISDGELARAVLLVIASDPEHRAGIELMLDHPPSEKFVVVETALLVSAVLIALQTHVRFDRDKQGKWTVKIEKKPTDSSLLKDLVKKLLAFG
jgi:hypothetical protein